MSYPIEVIANWFLLKESMTHKKLQKLCYYAQAWGYALYDAPFINEAFQAWVHGPVSPLLYEKYKDSYLKKLTPEDIDMSMIEEDDQDFLERVWLTYGEHTPNSLEVLTQKEQPWKEARVGYKTLEPCTNEISPVTMQRFYRSIYDEGDA